VLSEVSLYYFNNDLACILYGEEFLICGRLIETKSDDKNQFKLVVWSGGVTQKSIAT